jgi:hypothetical protein
MISPRSLLSLDFWTRALCEITPPPSIPPSQQVQDLLFSLVRLYVIYNFIFSTQRLIGCLAHTADIETGVMVIENGTFIIRRGADEHNI